MQHAILNFTSLPLYSRGSKYSLHTAVILFQEGQYNLRTGQGWQMALYFVCSMLSRGIMQQTWHGAMLLSNDQENIVGILHCCNTFEQSTWQNGSDSTRPVWPNHCIARLPPTRCKLSANTVHTSAEIAVPLPAATAQCLVCSFPPDLLTASLISVTWCGPWPMDHSLEDSYGCDASEPQMMMLISVDARYQTLYRGQSAKIVCVERAGNIYSVEGGKLE